MDKRSPIAKAAAHPVELLEQQEPQGRKTQQALEAAAAGAGDQMWQQAVQAALAVLVAAVVLAEALPSTASTPVLVAPAAQATPASTLGEVST